MSMTNKVPKILAISGSDILSGGGFQADLATFAAHGCYGFVAVTALVTVGDAGSGFEIEPVSTEVFKRQLKSLGDVPFDAIKIGLLPSVEIAELTLSFIQAHQELPIIFDPVLVFKENQDKAVSQMTVTLQSFLPYVTVITPNLREAEQLSGLPIRSVSELAKAARYLSERGSRHTVIKGGARLDKALAYDGYDDGQDFHLLSKPIVQGNNHGAGCTFASALACQMARGETVLTAVKKSKAFVYQAILQATEYGVFQHDLTT